MKSVLLFLAFSSFIYSAFSQQVNLEKGVVAYYPFNGNADDESGNGNKGIVYGATLVPDRNGKANSAYSFDGRSNYIKVAHSESLNLKKFSIAMWVNARSFKSFDQSGGIVLSKGVYPKFNYRISADFYNKQNQFCVAINAYGDYIHLFTEDHFETNRWHFVATTYDGSVLKVYVNGKLSSEKQISNLLCNNEAFYIGKYQENDEWSFNGLLDDIRLYNRAISEQELIALYGRNPVLNTNSDPVVLDVQNTVKQEYKSYRDLFLSKENLKLEELKYCTETFGSIDTIGRKLFLKKDGKTANITIQLDLEQEFIISAKVKANAENRNLFYFYEGKINDNPIRHNADVRKGKLIFYNYIMNYPNTVLFEKTADYRNYVDLTLKYFNDSLEIALDNVVVFSKKKSRDQISLSFSNNYVDEPLVVDELQVNKIVRKSSIVESVPYASKMEKWMLLDQTNPIFEFVFNKDHLIASHGGKTFRLNETSPQKYKAKELGLSNEDMSNYSFFKDMTFAQKRSTSYTLTYTSPFKMNLLIEQNWISWAYSSSIENLTLVKDLKDENDKAVEQLKAMGILYRTEFKYGKIGTDYVPAYTSTYNAGQKFQINGMDVELVDKKERVVSGGYDKDINGYTVVYQLVNQSSKNYLINFKIGGTSKMTDIVKNGSFFSYREYKTDITYSDFNYTKAVLLKPNESFKHQLIVGVDVPVNYSLFVNDIKEVSNDWVLSLSNAIAGNDIIKARDFANDPFARKYFNELISSNIKKLSNEDLGRSTELNRKFIKIEIYPENPVVFDPDFNSEVITKISNNSPVDLSVSYKTPFSQEVRFIKSKSSIVFKNTIKGFAKEKLNATILTISKTN